MAFYVTWQNLTHNHVPLFIQTPLEAEILLKLEHAARSTTFVGNTHQILTCVYTVKCCIYFLPCSLFSEETWYFPDMNIWLNCSVFSYFFWLLNIRLIQIKLIYFIYNYIPHKITFYFKYSCPVDCFSSEAESYN